MWTRLKRFQLMQVVKEFHDDFTFPQLRNQQTFSTKTKYRLKWAHIFIYKLFMLIVDVSFTNLYYTILREIIVDFYFKFDVLLISEH